MNRRPTRKRSFKSRRKQLRKRDVVFAQTYSRAAYELVQNESVFRDIEELRKAFNFVHLYPEAVPWLIKTIQRTQSPIERMMVFVFPGWGGFPEAQYAVGRYRLDCAFPAEKIAVELDGQEYHSSAEARTKDATRDRFLMSEGWRVLRFTGREVWKDAGKCAQEVRIIRHLDETSYPDRLSLSAPPNTGEGNFLAEFAEEAEAYRLEYLQVA